MNHFDQKLENLGYKLPSLSTNKAAFVPFVISGNLVFISGQLPLGFGQINEHKGKLGNEFNIEQGQKIAEYCILNVIAQLKSACNGDLDRVNKCVKLTIFVNSTLDFTDQPLIANAASEIINKVFDIKGNHARSAIGVNQLPLGVAVEIEAIFEIR